MKASATCACVRSARNKKAQVQGLQTSFQKSGDVDLQGNCGCIAGQEYMSIRYRSPSSWSRGPEEEVFGIGWWVKGS
eukprot:1137676-Pelagomonas_calceolata.AAC.3